MMHEIPVTANATARARLRVPLGTAEMNGTGRRKSPATTAAISISSITGAVIGYSRRSRNDRLAAFRSDRSTHKVQAQ
ncbi:MAG: hypothetical protein ACR652_24160, partial [Methylocystis sp.]|uniref:hypothetical protein n=1 Tax=Methylocystis sp. TaxID=1911079 RepID=UPI003DA49947